MSPQQGSIELDPEEVDEVVEPQLGECDLCEIDSPVYFFDRVCCRVRFVLRVPLLEVRRCWLDRWKRKDRAMGELIEAEVLRRWEESR